MRRQPIANHQGEGWTEKALASLADQPQEPEPARCESTTGGGRYRCALNVGHSGRHRASGVFNTWSDPTL